MTTQAYMTLTTVAAWVFLALVAIGLAYGIYEAVTTYFRERAKDREEAMQDPYLFETLEEAVEAYRQARDDYNKLSDKYNGLNRDFIELQDAYQDLSMKCRRHAVGIERENVERKSDE